jgi:hypothetical protein
VSREPCVIDIAIGKLGVRQGFKACLYVAMWGVAAEGIGHAPASPGEVAEYWGRSQATLYRGQVAFRKAFSPELTPERLWLLARKRVEGKVNEREAVSAVSSMRWVSP